MAKSSGLGQRFHIGTSTLAYDLSGDIGSIESASGGPTLLNVTAINAPAMERIGGVRDGALAYMAYYNPAVGAAHEFYSALPTADVIAFYATGTAVGDPVYCLLGKQADYLAKRGTDGSMVFNPNVMGNGSGAEWCQQLLAKTTHASATNGTSINFGAASTAFGASAYIIVFSVATGTLTPVIQDSADNTTFVAITGMTFANVAAAASGAQRVQSSATQTIRQYVRLASTGTFTNAVWMGAFIRHLTTTL